MLGTGIVVLGHALLPFSSAATALHHPAFWLGLVYLAVFSASFVVGEIKDAYGRVAWILDLAEVLLILGGLYLLGLLDSHTMSDEYINAAYLVLLVTQFGELGWRKVQGLSLHWTSQWERYCAMGLLLLAALSHSHRIWLAIDFAVVALCITYITQPSWLTREPAAKAREA